MSEDPSIVAQAFSSWGATVTPVSTSAKEETDWLIEHEGCRLLVEEKMKLEDPASTVARDVALAEGNVHGTATSLSSNNRISGIVRKAVDQLSSTGSEIEHDLRIIWFTGIGFDGQAKQLQFISTLYGSTDVFEVDKRRLKPCYFFRNSDFFRYRDRLDGAVAAYLTGNTVTFRMCLNPYSAGWLALRDSPYAKHFCIGLIDPVAEEKQGAAYVADTDLPRSDESAVLRFLEHKYGLVRAHKMDMNIASAVVRIPHDR